MSRTSPTEYADKWARRLTAATGDIRTGVERVTEAPGLAAAAQADKMLAGIQAAVSSGKWARQVSSVSLADWKAATIDKGIGRIASGVEAAKPKQVQMAEKLLAAVDSAVSRVDAMPSTTLEDRIQRMVMFARTMAESQIK